MKELDGKTAIVTGAGRGIGRAIARNLARNGAKVGLVSRTAVQLEETQSLIAEDGGSSIVVPLDVTHAEEVRQMVARVERELGAIDILVNNAGRFNTIGPVWEVDPESWWQDVSVNLRGTFLCAKAVLPAMMERRKGIIINMIGGGTARPLPYGSAYGSSKAAVMRFTETLAEELGTESGISVFAMGPGLVRTAMTEIQLSSPEGRRWMTGIAERFASHADRSPEDAARLAAALASGRYGALHGHAINAAEDPDAVLKEIDRIRGEELRTLRMR